MLENKRACKDFANGWPLFIKQKIYFNYFDFWVKFMTQNLLPAL